MHRFLSTILILIVLASCSQSQQSQDAISTEASVQKNEDTFFHYSIWWAFVNKVFDGDLSVTTMKANGDIGLGSYTQLDGEMIMLDGVPYRIRESGEVSIANESDKIVYANAAFFDKDEEFEVKELGIGDPELREIINQKMKSPNYFYAFKVHGTFEKIKCGGLTKQEPPYQEGLDVLIPYRPVFESENISGTMVGFYCPQFIGNINVAGYHFHFISDDKKYGGHVMEYKTSSPLSVELDKMNNYHFYLPDNEAYEKVSLEKEFQYKKD